jgi:GH43 family beta-xylosidase
MKKNIASCLPLFLILITFSNCKKGGKPFEPPPFIIPKDTTFTNPLLPSGPDPYVVKKDSFYYYMHTVGDRIQVWRTKAMSDLRNAYNQTIWTKPASGPNSQNVWAPELFFLDNKWYAYYTAGTTTDLATQRMFVLENQSTDPMAGTWIEKGKIADPAADFFAIDATLLEYNNKRYLIYSGQISAADNTQRIYIAQILNPWTLSSARVQISAPQLPWETNGPVNEGPEILKNAAGRVFLIYSGSGCWTDDYALGMLTLADGADPMVPASWTKSTTPVFAKNPAVNVYGPGHNGFFKSADGTEDWIIYHANSAPGNGNGCGNSRSPRMQKFTWNTDGTPNFGTPVSTTTILRKPKGE